jgi:RNA polymerase sigma-70 factor (ECF subfamily)
MELTDQAAAAEAQLGNQQAFRVLVERHSRTAFRLAYRMTGNEHDAEDLVQESFLRAYKQLHTFDGRAAFGTWLHRICVNCSLDFLRSRKNRKELPNTTTDGETAHWLDQVSSPLPSPERLTHSGQIASLIEPALNRLSENERAAFVMRHYEGCNMDQIAATLGIQIGAAKNTVFRAVQKLREALEPALGVAR